MLFVRMLSYLI